MARAVSPSIIGSLQTDGCSKMESRFSCHIKRKIMLGTVLVVLLILMLLGAIPAWPHSKNWGYGPTGGIGLILVILIVLLLMG